MSPSGRKRWGARLALLLALAPASVLGLGACEREPDPDDPPPLPARPPNALPRPASSLSLPSSSPAPAALSSGAALVEREVRATRLTVPPNAGHQPRLAFGRGVLGQLTGEELRVFDTASFQQVASFPLPEPRALLTLADGALLAVGNEGVFRFEPNNKKVERLGRLPMPWADVFADAQQRDRVWIFDSGGTSSLGPARLLAFRLEKTDSRIFLPEQTIELTSPRGGVVGQTREGVWVYLTAERAERLSPSGLRLPGFPSFSKQLPTWILPTRRLEQAWLLDDSGWLSRAQMIPPPRRLGAPLQLVGRPYSVAVGDQGRLLTATVVTGAGPRFELVLIDAELKLVARRELPSEDATADETWIQTVTANQEVAASATKPLIAVGGRSRVTIFDGAGQVIFSIPSR